jgi:hypothetical protein
MTDKTEIQKSQRGQNLETHNTENKRQKYRKTETQKYRNTEKKENTKGHERRKDRNTGS